MKLFHFIISSLKSGRSSYLVDVLVGLLYPVISLQVREVPKFDQFHRSLVVVAVVFFFLVCLRNMTQLNMFYFSSINRK